MMSQAHLQLQGQVRAVRPQQAQLDGYWDRLLVPLQQWGLGHVSGPEAVWPISKIARQQRGGGLGGSLPGRAWLASSA